MIVARPNQSASWRANLLVLLALCVPSLGAGVFFALQGAWPILPFAGLEMLALGGALYYVNWKLHYRHVITLSEDTVRIDKGHFAPKQSWQFQRCEAGLSITAGNDNRYGPEVCVHDQRDKVILGDFLGREDCQTLIDLLRPEIRVRAESRRGEQSF